MLLKNTSRPVVFTLGLVIVMAVLLNACGSSYQAPVAERGERQVVNAPLIADSSTPNRRRNRPEADRVAVSTPVADRYSSDSRAVATRPALSHRVGRGDTLYSIAFQYDLDFRSLALANGLNPPYTIFVDQVLSLVVDRIDSNRANVVSTLGTPVGNNSVARSQAGSPRRGGVSRQPIAATPTDDPRWQWPHDGEVVRGFEADINKGIDIGGLRGEPVLAAGDGDVVYSGSGIQGSGDLIIIRHSDRYLSAYSHNSVMLVSEGSRVSAGQQIAEVGENPAGVAVLHFEIRQDGKSVDPISFLPRR